MTQDLAPQTCDVANMIAAGQLDAAVQSHAAYALAELEREDPNLLDLWLAGALLEAVQTRNRAVANG